MSIKTFALILAITISTLTLLGIAVVKTNTAVEHTCARCGEGCYEFACTAADGWRYYVCNHCGHTVYTIDSTLADGEAHSC